MAAEIQQTSDITYRVYDWDRTDGNGNKRELHLEQSMKATKEFDEESKRNFQIQKNAISNMVDCNYFTTNIFEVHHQVDRDYSELDSFIILMCVEGSAEISTNGITESVKIGETLLLPAKAENTRFSSKGARFIEVYVD